MPQRIGMVALLCNVGNGAVIQATLSYKSFVIFRFRQFLAQST